ncbi:hypothetical protein Ciccas_013529, partial [Cichlidogyrus casuarinus]
MGVLVLAYFLVELVVGYVVNSIALIADSFHMFSDLLSIFIGFAALKISKWPRSSKNTFGWQRAEVMGSMVNSVVLVTLCMTICFEVAERLFKQEPVDDPWLMLIVGSVGLLINLVGLVVLGSHSHGHGHGHGHSHAVTEVSLDNEQEIVPDNTTLNQGDPNGDLHENFYKTSLILLQSVPGDVCVRNLKSRIIK